jgi:hypothetical protein
MPIDPRHKHAEDQPQAEQDERFPSGPWKGFFLQPILAGKHWMELILNFHQGNIRGEGRDWVGDFLVRGGYDVSEGKCWLTKTYIGKHSVAYMGYNEGKGIWGTWEMKDPPWRGGFHIWPLGMGADSESLETAEELDEPVLVGSLAEESLSEGSVSGDPLY